MANFFVVLGDRNRTIRRLPVTRDLQLEMTVLFQEQRDRLLAPDREQLEFEAGFTPDEGQILRITPYAVPASIAGAVADPTRVEALALEHDEPPQIKSVLCADPATGEIQFQAFDRRRVLSRRGFSLVLSGETFRRLNEPGLTLDSKLAAVIVGTTLFFESYFAASRVLDLTAYYREASDTDIARFCALANVSVSDPANLREIADTWTRRRLAAILESDLLARESPRRIQNAARAFGVPVIITRHNGRDRLVIPENKQELKQILRFLQEDYFTSVLTGTKYLANSKRHV